MSKKPETIGGMARFVHATPWLTSLILASVLTLDHMGIIDKETNELDMVCEVLGVTPDQILCTDEAYCDINTIMLSATAMETNRVVRGICPGTRQEVLLRFPFGDQHPDAETLADMQASFGALASAEREAMLTDALTKMGYLPPEPPSRKP